MKWYQRFRSTCCKKGAKHQEDTIINTHIKRAPNTNCNHSYYRGRSWFEPTPSPYVRNKLKEKWQGSGSSGRVLA
jgi:hypothetical protein